MADRPDSWDAVFWDLGGVVVTRQSIRAAQQSFVERLVDTLGIAADADAALDTWRQTVGDSFRARDGTEYRPANDAYRRGVRAVAGEPVARDVWRPLFDEAFAESIRPTPGAISTLETLAARDVHVGCVSDIDNREARTVLSEFDVRDLFDSVTTSEDVGRTKPDPALFEAALEAASVPAERSLMVGDRPGHDVVGAANAGLWTVGYQCEFVQEADAVVEDLQDVVLFVDGDLDLTADVPS